MPVLSATDRAMPRSALRHRPIENDVDRQGKRPPATAGITPIVQRASRLRSPETEEDEEATPGAPPTGPRPKTPRLIRTGGRRRGMLRAHPLLLLGLGMILMLVLLVEYDVGRSALRSSAHLPDRRSRGAERLAE